MAKKKNTTSQAASASSRKAASSARKRLASSAGKKVEYDEDSIKTLDPLAHIRLRTGMYIGRLGDGSHPSDGIYVLLKELIDNSIDEFIMGAGKKIEIVYENDMFTVRDYGRGIPLGKVVECVSQMNTGGKYSDDVFQFSVGLNGVGSKAANALSEYFMVTSWRDGKFKRATFKQGVLVEEKSGREAKMNDGTLVRFKPDPEIFNSYTWNLDFVRRRLRYYTFLNSGLTLTFNGDAFHSKNGLQDLLKEELDEEPLLYDQFHYKDARIEFAFTHTNKYGESYFSFVNGQYTNDGGTHQSAFREGVLKGVNEFAKKKFAGEDVRDGFIGAVAIKLQDPVFESQTKNKLGSTEVRQWMVKAVSEAVVVWLHRDKKSADALVVKIRSNERIRTELASIKKEARDRAKKVAIRIPKLTDCKVHYTDTKDSRHEASSIFLTEGDSAGGSMTQCRDVYTQSIFRLKGKPLNCYGMKLDVVYKNEELYNIMRALGLEDGMDGLRYNKVIIATDADVDGMHIRNLLLTYFLRFFEDLVIHGHIYILETPLYRVRNKAETRYCYSEQERNKALAEVKNPETTRFKGLGEISPNEMGLFIGDDIRLINVEFESMSKVTKTLEFYMGKNTPERRLFIEKNLISDIS